MKIVAVTACVSGVAHTYMAAELLEKHCQKKGIKIEVETQGALGTENALSEQAVEQADIAIIVADINIDGEMRFAHTRQIRAKISTFLRQPELVFGTLEKVYNAPPNTVLEI
jgi:fructose-specific PTS system IIB-like component